MGDKEEEEVIRIDCKEQAVDGIGILSELLGFLLFMHHQIPQTIDQLQQCPPQTLVFPTEEPHTSNPQQKRARTRHLRETLRHLKKLGKLTDSIHSLLSALRVAFRHLPSIPAVLFVLGSSPKRPLKAYEVHFLGLASSPVPANLNVSKNFSKQITRALISHDGGPLPAGAFSAAYSYIRNISSLHRLALSMALRSETRNEVRARLLLQGNDLSAQPVCPRV